jgi:Ca2+-binding RTX toxin-like protein
LANLVGACRDSGNSLQINPSRDDNAGAGTDGADYIEGGGGSDVIFGNQGQDDIVGGSSDLFTLTAPAQRNDQPNIILGGSGTDIARNDLGATGLNAHSHDSDAIVANNGDIVRLVGTNGTPMASGFLIFNYDNYTGETEHIVPRAIKLLDYTPGGPDLLGIAGPIVTGNLGAAVLPSGQAHGTEMHGENGDDFMYGGPGNDVMFGEGQNDTMIGGYGNDWMSGGTGDDGMLGDDGRLLTSREGLTEPLIGLTTPTTQQMIATGGNLQQALINVNGELLYRAVLVPDNLDPLHRQPFTLMPRPLYASDIMYGGLGSDMMHGGAGEDAMSGAEAPGITATGVVVTSYTNSYRSDGSKINNAPIESDYARPFNPGNVLGYNPSTTKFHEYDASDPLRKVMLNCDGSLFKGTVPAGCTGEPSTGFNWLLNFDATEGPLDTQWIQGQTKYAAVATDGNDALFGDLGHDWLVGGTGRDRLFGGWGDDLLNIDDNLDTHGGHNDQADTNPSYEDLAYGGAGRDVLIANTGGDRMIDWVGEFNTYLVPFSPFGMNMLSDQIQPGLPQFLYDLSKSDGADQTLAVRYASDPARNGEPFGELGLVLQQDAAYNDQRGKPRDPQAGNLTATRDVLRTSGTQVINSPGTCCDPPVGGSGTPKQVSAPLTVDNVSQTSMPAVISGPSGTAATYTVTDGTKTVGGAGIEAADGMLPATLDLSGLADGVLTVTLTPGDGTGPVTSAIVKNTVQPGSPGISALAYVGLSQVGGATFTVIGQPGAFAYLTVFDGVSWQDAAGTLDVTGTISLTLDLTRLSDGTLTATVTLTNASGSTSSNNLMFVKDTVAPAAPAVSLPAFVNLVNRTAVPLVVTGEAGATATVSATDGTTTVTGTGVVGSSGSVTIALNLTTLKDGRISASAYQTDLSGNVGAAGAPAVATKNTVPPAGGFTINAGGPVINGVVATTNPTLSMKLSFTDSTGLVTMAFSTNGGMTFGAPVTYASSASVAINGVDGVYIIAVQVMDGVGNPTVVTQQMRLDRIGPAISYTITAPANNGSYDVGQVVTLSYSGSDPDNVASISAVLDSKTTLNTGSSINTETLVAGSHTITITAKDALGNVSTSTINFQVHATIAGLTTAVNDGVTNGQITSSVAASKLLSLLSLAQSALNAGNNAQAKTYLNAFVSVVQQYSGKGIATAYANLMIGWANDLISRL